MNHFRHQKYKNKELNNTQVPNENDFKASNKCIKDRDKLKKKRTNKEENIYKKDLVQLGQINIFRNL